MGAKICEPLQLIWYCTFFHSNDFHQTIPVAMNHSLTSALGIFAPSSLQNAASYCKLDGHLE